MKILAFADLHGWFDIISDLKQKSEKHDVDLILCAGDVTLFGENQKKILKKLNDIGKTMLIINGNHENEQSLIADLEEYENLVYINRGAYRLDNYIFFGYGDGGFSVDDPDFSHLSSHFSNDINDGDKVVLLSHGPPHGTKVDLLHGSHAGSKSVTEFIKKHKVELVVTGHFHETFGVEDKIDETLVTNPGPKGKIYEI